MNDSQSSASEFSTALGEAKLDSSVKINMNKRYRCFVLKALKQLQANTSSFSPSVILSRTNQFATVSMLKMCTGDQGLDAQYQPIIFQERKTRDGLDSTRAQRCCSASMLGCTERDGAAEKQDYLSLLQGVHYHRL